MVGDGDVVAVLGPGMRGLCSAVAAKEAGAGFVLVTGAGERDRLRLELAWDFGADLVVDVAEEDPRAALEAATGGLADVVVDVTANAPAALVQGIGLARPRGRMVVAGTRDRRPRWRSAPTGSCSRSSPSSAPSVSTRPPTSGPWPSSPAAATRSRRSTGRSPTSTRPPIPTPVRSGDRTVQYAGACKRSDLICRATTTRRGRELIFVDIVGEDEAGNPVAHAILTYRIVP